MSIETLVRRIFGHRRLLIVVLLAVTALFAVGAAMVEESASVGEFQTDSVEAEKLEYIEQNFSADENTTTVQVVIRDGNVLDRETLQETLAFQADLQANRTVNATLVDDQPITSVANAVATAAITEKRAAELEARSERLNATVAELETALDRVRAGDASAETAFDTARANAPLSLTDEHYETFAEAARALQAAEDEAAVEEAYRLGTRGVLADESETLVAEQRALADGIAPSLAQQRAQLASMSDEQIADVVGTVLGPENAQLLAFMPDGYEPGETSANATAFVVTQATGGDPVTPDAAPEVIIDSQFAIQDIATDRPGEYVVFGNGISAHEFEASMNDSLAVVGPLALLFVLVVLMIAYRDPLDVGLGLFGIVAVLVWTFGFMGWAGIEFGQLFIAVPVLLIGLSIDYAIHVFMRGREARTGTERSVAEATTAGLAGVGLALVLVTVTTAAGFLSNLVSPMPPVREFGVVNAVGIVSALFVFGLLVPALKVEIDSFLEARGIDRRKGAFGTSGRLEPVLRTGERLARAAPVAVLVVVLLVSAGGVYGATQVDTSFSTDQFIAEDPPGWTDSLPESVQPEDYTVAEALDYLDETFVRQDMQTNILVEGDPTDPNTLERVESGEAGVANASTTRRLVNGDPAMQGPVRTMHRVAAENESFNATLAAADTTGDGVPDTDIEGVYDALFAADPAAASEVVHRTPSGEYEALRIVSFAAGDVTRGDVTDEMQAVAADIDGPAVTATATGQQTVLYHLVSEEIFDTVVQSLVATLLAVGLFLVVTSRITAGSATLGVVTVLPVVLALSWILGTMYLLGLSFNSITGMITSLTIGLGVAYSIHVTQRYRQQLDRDGAMWPALRATVTGTGGALLGSAATTAGGFGVLTFSFMPALKQFGFIIGISIVYAFLASVLVLPSILVLWTRWFGPDVAGTDATGAVAPDGTADAADDD
jgi:hydrophobe/amphiphile efflux-3 (HAE3) family protein